MGYSTFQPIVTDGIVFNIDPYNSKSYNGVSNIVTDIVSGITGSLVNGVTFSGRSFYFDGINDNIKIGTQLNNSFSTTITFSSWVKFTSQGVYTIVHKGNPIGVDFGLFLINNYFSFASHGADTPLNSPTNIKTNTWYNIVITLTGTTAIMYIDGTQISTSTTMQGFDNVLSESFYFGTSNDASIYFLNGNIGQVSMYNRVLLASEILYNYNATKWRFEEHPIVEDGLVYYIDPKNTSSYPGTGTTVTSLKGGYNGSLVNGVTFDNISFRFDGSNDYLVTSSGFPVPTNNRTFECWIKFNSVVNSFSPLLAQSSSFDNSASANLTGLQTISGSSFVILPVGNGTTYQAYSGGFDYSSYIGRWIHVVGTVEGSVASKIYLNGSLVSNVSISINPEQVSRHITTGYFTGPNMNISSIKVYNRVLTQSEILQNYNATKNRFL